jgi:hypothetical protein
MKFLSDGCLEYRGAIFSDVLAVADLDSVGCSGFAGLS